MYVGRLLVVQYVPQCYNKMYWQSHYTNNLKLTVVLLFVEFNTTMALAILMEQLDFVGAGVGQSCWCETAQGDQH